MPRKKIDSSPTWRPGMTVAEFRAIIEADKVRAMDRFERDWGTRDVRAVAEALRQTIPDSTNPADAATKALARVRGAKS